MDLQRKKKIVWKYFEEDPNSNITEARCLICRQTMKHHNGIASLVRHLKSKHSLEVDIVEQLKSDSYANTSGVSAAKQRRIEEAKQKLAQSPEKKSLLDQFMSIVAVDFDLPDPSLVDRSTSSVYPESTPTIRLRKSPIWKYFESHPGNKQASCILCNDILRHHGNTTNLMKHLKSKHAPEAMSLHLNHGNFQKSNNEIGTPVAASSASSHLSSNKTKANLAKVKTERIEEPKQPSCSVVVGLARNNLLDQKLISLIIGDLQPVSIVESIHFVNLMKIAEVKYNIPSKHKINTEMLPNLYKETVARVLNRLDEIQYIALTTEMWSPRDQESYLGVTAHFICPSEWVLQSVMLSTTAFYGTPTGEHIASELKRTVAEWNITEKISVMIVDNNTNILLSQCDERLPWAYIPCIAHLIHVVVTKAIAEDNEALILINKVSGVVRFFKQDLDTREKLLEAQKSLNLPEHKLVLHVACRWNSVYFMFDRMLEQVDAVNAVLEAYDKYDMFLTTEDGEIMRKITSSLKPFDIATKTLSSEKSSTIGTALPLVKGLLKMMNSVSNTKEPLVDNLRRGLMESFGKIEEMEWIVASTILDPRFKKFPYTDKEVLDKATSVLTAEFTKMIEEKTLGAGDKTDDVTTEEDSLWMYLDVITNSNKDVNKQAQPSLATLELQRYLESPPIPRDDSPLLYWRQHEELYPNLCKLAIKYMTVPITSVPCDRLFTRACETSAEKRSQLKAKNVNMMLFLNRNFSFTGLPPPTQY